MSKNTLRLDDELKAGVALAAAGAGMTPRAFTLDAIARHVEQADPDSELQRLADARWAKLLATAETVAWDEAKDYLQSRARGKRPMQPMSRTCVDGGARRKLLMLSRRSVHR